MRKLLVAYLILFGLQFQLSAQGPFSPAAHVAGSDAIPKNSNLIKAWASDVFQMTRGKQQYNLSQSDTATVGLWWQALGAADNQFLSLGDGGEITLSFQGWITDDVGPDLAVFENAFQVGANSDSFFIELGWVEASSDGINFFQFPAVSLTQDSVQLTNADGINPRNLHNLAGKYAAGFGVPFDLADLPDTHLLDKQRIKYVRIKDVVGHLQQFPPALDSKGNKINDPFPTPFESAGFDLDGVAAINFESWPLSVSNVKASEIYLAPNPCMGHCIISINENGTLISLTSGLKQNLEAGQHALQLSKGVYLFKTQSGQCKKLIVL